MTCPHGEPHPATCIDCIEGPPPAKAIARTRLPSTYEQSALFPSQCAHNLGHAIETGDTIRFVDGTGWCCVECAAAPS